MASASLRNDDSAVMTKVIYLSRAAAVVVAIWFAWTQVRPRLRARIPTEDQKLSGPERIAHARQARSKVIAAHFSEAGVCYPPRELFVRAFKHEAQVEAWARCDGDHFTLIHTYPIAYSSGHPGPKRREGDRQVPEGIYTLDRFNPLSLFHLSLRIDYPNASDRVLSDHKKPGFDIYLHGGDGSAGCIPVGDDNVEELYVIALDAGNSTAIPIHIFPARMSGAEWEKFAAPLRREHPELETFWQTLQPIYAAFEQTHRLPRVTIDKDGRYRLAAE